MIPTILGSVVGAWLLLRTSDRTFAHLIPFLILIASVTLGLQPLVKKLLGTGQTTLPLFVTLILQFLVSVYGGYFGAGMGIMMLALFAFFMEGTIHELNAIKNWLGTIINLSCSTIFILKGMVLLTPALVLVAGGIVGGYVAARWSQKLDPNHLRIAIVVYGVSMAVYFFFRSMTT